MNVSNITSLINSFRRLSQKDSITPETLGHIMQQIVDALGSLVNDADMAKMLQWFASMQDENAVVSLSQTLSDRNEIYLDASNIDLTTGERSSVSKAVIIKQATTDRAGAMRAQQVTDLNAAKKSVTSLETNVAALQELVSKLTPKITALETEASRLANYCDSLHEEIDRRCGQLASTLQTLQSQADTAQNLAEYATERLDHLYESKPWQDDIPIYKIAGIVYHMAEAGTFGKDNVYFCVADKMFFYKNEDDGSYFYNVPHNKVLNGIFAPNENAVYLLGRYLYFYNGMSLVTVRPDSELDIIYKRLETLEAKA